MARERKGFIVDQVWTTIHYIDTHGHRQKTSKVILAGDSKQKLTEADKHADKVKRAKQRIRETIKDLERSGATNCKGSVETRLYARVGYTDEHGRHDVIRAAESRTHARE